MNIDNERNFHEKRYADDQRNTKFLSSAYLVGSIAYEFFFKKLRLISEGCEVLEYGSGISMYANNIVLSAANITGIDISAEAVKISNSKMIQYDNCKYLVMDAMNLDFCDEKFNLVYGCGIIHHLDVDKAFSEIYRVTKHGGKTLFLEPLGHNPFVNFFRKLSPKLRSKDEHPLTIDDMEVIRKYFKKVNFTYFSLVSIALIPVVRVFPLFIFMVRFANFIDKLFFALRFPRRWAWIVIVECEK